MNLFLPMFFDCLEFIKSLQSPVVTFIKPPILNDWDVVAIYFVRSIVEGLDGTSQDRGIAEVELETILLEDFTSVDSLLDS